MVRELGDQRQNAVLLETGSTEIDQILITYDDNG
jgi:hypothetical protein